MLSDNRSNKARQRFEQVEQRETRKMDSANKFGLIFMVFIVGCSTLLPFTLGRKDPEFWIGVVYVISTFSTMITWVSLGYFHGRRVYQGSSFGDLEVASWSNSGWGKWYEIVLFYLVFCPLVLWVIYMGVVYFRYDSFNFMLLFIASALACFVQPIWMVGITIVMLAVALHWLSYYMYPNPIGIGNLLSISMGMVFGAFMFYMLKTQIHTRYAASAMADELDEANKQLREYSAKAEELSAMQERNRIAREIHDTLGHSLTVVNVQLEAASALMPDDVEKARVFVEKAKELTKKGLQDVRESVSSLRASPLDGKSLSEGIESLVSTVKESGIQGEFNVSGVEKELSPQVSSAIYRTAQEALTNVRKHSRAKTVEVELDFEEADQAKLVIQDDGIGCQNTNGGFGILGINERIQFLNGKTHIKTSTNEGFRLEVLVPV